MTMRLMLLEPQVVLTARVAQASFTYPIASVAYDSGVEFDDVLEGYTVVFGTSAGNDDLGRQRLRAGSTIGASGTLNFGRSSLGVMDGEVKLEDNAYITVYEDRRVWMKAPYIDDDGVIYKDHDIAYSDQNEEPPPVANAGIGFARSLSGGTSINCDFDGSDSFAVADGASISGYLWDVDDGMITVGNATDAQITANFPVGFRYVTLTVTDSNGKTHSAYVPVFCRDPGSDATIQTFEIAEHRITPDGQEMAFRVLDDIPVDDYPNGTLVMLWEGEPSSNSDRSHMRFIGWHMTDPAQITAERTGTLRDTTLRCGDVGAMLNRLPGFPVEIVGASSPGNWGQMLTPNMDKYLHFLLHWHSTALDVVDWDWTGTGSNYPFVILGSDGESLWEQVQSKAKALVPDYVMTVNRFGQIRTLPDPMLQDTGDRTSEIQATLDDGDIEHIAWTAQNFPRVHWLRGSAIVADADTISAIFCIAPGEAPGQGLSEQPSGEQLAQSQADLNACEGHRYARLNAPNSMFSITLAGGDDLDLEPADMEWLVINSSITAQRGLSLAGLRGLIREMNITYEMGVSGLVRSVELQLEQETDGEPAVTEIVEAELPPPDYDPPDDDGYDPDPGPEPGGEGDGFGTVYVVDRAAVYRTRDFSATPPTWADITGSITGAVHDFILDPWDPINGAMAVSEDGVWRSTTMANSSPTWSLVLSKATMTAPTNAGTVVGNAAKIVGSITHQGYFAAGYSSGGSRCHVATTTDGGDNWTINEIPTNANVFDGGLDIAKNGSNRLYALVRKSNAYPRGVYLVRSDNFGATWTNMGTQRTSGSRTSGYRGRLVHVPYHDNENADVVYWSVASTGTVANHTAVSRRSTDGGNSWTTIDSNGGTTAKRTGIETHNQNRLQVSYWRSTHDGFNSELWVSDDGGDTWNTVTTSVISGRTVASGGFPTIEDLFYAVTHSGGVYVSSDGGVTWVDKTGSLSLDIAVGFGVIVPVWVAE